MPMKGTTATTTKKDFPPESGEKEASQSATPPRHPPQSLIPADAGTHGYATPVVYVRPTISTGAHLTSGYAE